MALNSPNHLTSTANAKVKHLVRMRNNRARRKAGCILVDGWRETAQALDAGYQLRGVYYVKDQSEPSQGNHDSTWRTRVLRDAQVINRTQFVSSWILEKIGYGESQRGVVAEFERPVAALSQIRLGPSSVCLVLDRIEKPGNVGAIFRSAEAAGIDAVLLADGGDPLHPNAIRSSSGGVFHVPWAMATEREIASFLAAHNTDVFAARVESSESVWDVQFDKTTAIVLGNEAEGLGDRWQSTPEHPIGNLRIPMAGKVDSLNVSVAAALLAFHTTRCRKA